MVWGGFDPTQYGWTTMMNVEERIRFLVRAAIRAQGDGDLRIAGLFRRMAADMRTGEGAPMPSGPVLVAAAD